MSQGQKQEQRRRGLDSTGNRIAIAVVIGLVCGKFFVEEQAGGFPVLLGAMVVVAAVAYAVLTMLRR